MGIAATVRPNSAVFFASTTIRSWDAEDCLVLTKTKCMQRITCIVTPTKAKKSNFSRQIIT